MSAALEGQDLSEGVPSMNTLRKQGEASMMRDIAEEVAEGRMPIPKDRSLTPKQRRKQKETKRRRVVNLPDDYSWFLEQNLDTLGYENVPQALRELSRIGLEQMLGDVASSKAINRAYRKHVAEQILAQIEAEDA